MFDPDEFLQPYAAKIGFPIDQVKFLLCLFVAYPLGFLHHSISSQFVKHFLSASIGILFGMLCFGWFDMLHTLGMAIPVYLLSFFKFEKMPALSFIFCLTYLSSCHIYRMITDYGSWTMDITGPLMLLTVKLSSYSFNVQDGRRLANKNSDIVVTKEQAKYALSAVPNPLEFAGFVYFYGGFLAGPSIEIQDYLRFTSREMYPGKVIPNTFIPAFKKFLTGLFFMVLLVAAGVFCPNHYIKTEEFRNTRTFLYKFFYILLGVASSRLPYYSGWIMAEGGCVAAGLGYKVDETTKQVSWNGVSNVNVIALETAQSFKDVVDNWNINTGNWLRRYVYVRLTPKSGKPTTFTTVATYLTSAFWHGFYPGYYLTFFSGALVTTTARNLRRHLRPLVHDSKGKPKAIKIIYDIFGWIITQFILDYICAAFVLLTIDDCLAFYKSMYFCGHIAIAAVFLFYQVFPVSSPKSYEAQRIEKSRKAQ